MKTIGLIIAMLFSVTSWGATPADGGPSFTIAGKVIRDTANLKVLSCTAVEAGQWWPFFKLDQVPPVAQGYQIPANQQFRVIAARLQESSGSDRCKFGYAAGPVTLTSSGSGTDPGTISILGGGWGGGINLNSNRGFFNSDASGREYYFGETGMIFPADPTGYWVFCSCNNATATSNVLLYGYEETP